MNYVPRLVILVPVPVHAKLIKIAIDFFIETYCDKFLGKDK